MTPAPGSSLPPYLSPPASDTVRIGKYRVLTALGRGGMAEVLLAQSGERAETAKLVVIKRLLHDLADEPDLQAMFLDEARLALRLTHPNVVQTFDVIVDQGQPLIVMEFLAGQPTSALRRVQTSPLPLPQQLSLLCGWLKGLHYAHELTDYDGLPLHIVHRDISPQNLFITYDGVAKIVDFGIAKSARRTLQTQSSHSFPKGKVRYMAPEQARGDAIDGRADVFAMGVVMFELLTRSRYWSRDLDDLVILASLFHDELPTPLTYPDTLSPALRHIIDRATAPRPEDRYRTADDMRQDIEQELHRLGRPGAEREVAHWMQMTFAEQRQEQQARIRAFFLELPPVPTEPPPPTARRPRAWMIAAPVAALAVAIVGLRSAAAPAPVSSAASLVASAPPSASVASAASAASVASVASAAPAMSPSTSLASRASVHLSSPPAPSPPRHRPARAPTAPSPNTIPPPFLP